MAICRLRNSGASFRGAKCRIFLWTSLFTLECLSGWAYVYYIRSSSCLGFFFFIIMSFFYSIFLCLYSPSLLISFLFLYLPLSLSLTFPISVNFFLPFHERSLQQVKADVQQVGDELVVSGLDSATSLIQTARNLLNAVVATVKNAYIISTKVSRLANIVRREIRVWFIYQIPGLMGCKAEKYCKGSNTIL